MRASDRINDRGVKSVAANRPAKWLSFHVYFPGSTIGNFEPETVTEFLMRLVELVGAPLHGEPDGMIVLSVRDLTERRRWEVAGDQVARFQSLMHNAATVTMLSFSKTGFTSRSAFSA